MNRKTFLVIIILLVFTIPLFSQYSLPELELELKIPVFKFVSYFAVTVSGEDEYEVPNTIRNNSFYLESIRLTRLAQDTFEYGDYIASAGFAEEAIRYAQLSDEFVAGQLITEAERMLNWADDNNIPVRFPYDYRESRNYYDNAIAFYDNENWDDSITASTRSIQIISIIQSGGVAPLPGQYTVRPWALTRDCLWNIAAYPWVYGDPWKWTILYEANKSNMIDPNNPDLIDVGMILNIPSIDGELRFGMWDQNRTYTIP